MKGYRNVQSPLMQPADYSGSLCYRNVVNIRQQLQAKEEDGFSWISSQVIAIAYEICALKALLPHQRQERLKACGLVPGNNNRAATRQRGVYTAELIPFATAPSGVEDSGVRLTSNSFKRLHLPFLWPSG